MKLGAADVQRIAQFSTLICYYSADYPQVKTKKPNSAKIVSDKQKTFANHKLDEQKI